ncbi:zinc finger protein draculin-like [Zerene cesonia]|uniref:zinc finger protein draculin-like n=1 Tax=Zerene cesonia TaxID=33412 RepID=UPI0018E56054|nr:zinc finger protein draculin-like [Zerene cesonia]XP_038221491.1 zinc finger protein draculin-like [Zerene cesonia]
MTAMDEIDFNYEYNVKIELCESDNILFDIIKPKNESEITIDAEVFHKETFIELIKYEDLLLEAPRLCSLCDGIFPNSYSFLQHNTKHLKLSLDKCEIYSCITCSRKFSKRSDLANHEINCTIHTDDNNNKSTCPVCNMHIETSKLKNHQRNHRRKQAKCEICGLMINSHNMKRHVQNIHTKQHKICEHCGKSVKYRYYSTHIQKVHQNDKVKCVQCCKYFKSAESLEQHKLYIHCKSKIIKSTTPTDIQHRCDKCSSVFKLKCNLQAHVKRCRSVKCGLCGAILKNKQIHRNHLNWVHYKGKEHSCDVCGKTFKSPYSVRSHVKNSHATVKRDR